jgi:essential nuclear protein 1
VVPADLSRKILRHARAQLQDEADDDADADVDDKLVDADDFDDFDGDNDGEIDIDHNNAASQAVDGDDDEAVSRSARRSGAQRTRTREKQVALNEAQGRPIQLADDDDDNDDDDDGVVPDDDEDETGALGGLSAEDQAAMEMFMAPRKAKQQQQQQQQGRLARSPHAGRHHHGQAARAQRESAAPRTSTTLCTIVSIRKCTRSTPRSASTCAPTAAARCPRRSRSFRRSPTGRRCCGSRSRTSWSPNAVLKATTIFANAPNEKMTQRFYALVLLPRVRDEVQQTRKASAQVYQAIRKATYKPGAFFKGLVLPLAEDPDCSIREAFAFTTVLKRVALSAAALGRRAHEAVRNAVHVSSAMFLRCLIMKRYALPYKTIDALFVHFMSFLNETERMPNLWHECSARLRRALQNRPRARAEGGAQGAAARALAL